MAPSTESIKKAQNFYKRYLNTKPKLQNTLKNPKSYKELIKDYNELYFTVSEEDRSKLFTELFPIKTSEKIDKRIFGLEQLIRGRISFKTFAVTKGSLAGAKKLLESVPTDSSAF